MQLIDIGVNLTTPAWRGNAKQYSNAPERPVYASWC